MSKFMRRENFCDNLNFNNKKKSQKINKNFSLTKPDQFKWIKISCSGQSLDTCRTVVNILEDLIYKNTGRKSPLKAWNTYVDGKHLIFSLKLRKHDFECIHKNYYKVDSYDLKCMKHENVHIPAQFPSYWVDIIKEVLTNRFKTHLETNESELNLSSFSDDRILVERGLLLELASPRVLESILNILATVMKDLTYLDLSNNMISNFYKLKSFLKSVQVSKLNLSENRINHIQDFNCLEGSSVVNLNITGNRIIKKFTFDELKKDIRKLIPKLQFLNNKDLGHEIMIAGEAEKIQKTLPKVIESPKDTDAYNFVINFFSKFDMKNRDGLVDFYNTESILTMATWGESSSFYKSNNLNLKLSKNPDKRQEYIKKGKAQILGTFVNFPPTKHLTESLNVEMLCSTESFMFLLVTGVFVELPANKGNFYRPRQFSRTLTIVQGGIILQDFIQVFPNDAQLLNKYKSVLDQVKSKVEFANSYKALEDFSDEQIEMVHQFKSLTGLNVATCINFLRNFQGTAYEEFKKYQSAGTIPKESFID